MSEQEDTPLHLRTVDGTMFLVRRSTARCMQFVWNIIEESSNIDVIPLPKNIIATTLKEVVAWCDFHATRSTKDQSDFDETFFRSMGQDDVARIMIAANFLGIEALMELSAMNIATRVSREIGMT
jgi:hypothetical protein